MELIKQEYRNILVPVDGSKTAEKALERATEIARCASANSAIVASTSIILH